MKLRPELGNGAAAEEHRRRREPQQRLVPPQLELGVVAGRRRRRLRDPEGIHAGAVLLLHPLHPRYRRVELGRLVRDALRDLALALDVPCAAQRIFQSVALRPQARRELYLVIGKNE